jgi:3-oxosteroid 1-dehydrogenase
MFLRSNRKADEYDVVVVGSGAAGLTAALAAHDSGARVLILEKTDKLGGTTAVSGGGIWIPGNDQQNGGASAESRDALIEYCTTLTMDRAERTLIERFIDVAPLAIRYLEGKTPLRFGAVTTPDYHPEMPGARMSGRTIEPAPFDTTVLGAWKDKLRQPSALAFPVTLQEMFEDYKAFYCPWKIPQDLIVERMSKGVATMGQALAAGLLAGVLQRNVPIRLNARARRLTRTAGRITAISYEDGDETTHEVKLKRGVILASAGFEWNADLRKKFLPGAAMVPNSPPFNEGDGLLMAMEVGADLANMSEVWNYPTIAIPGETYDGSPLARGIKAERSGPHVIWVNARGLRFVNEAANYNSVGRAFHVMETNRPALANQPAWAIFDSQYRNKYIVGTTMPGDPDPNWLMKADSLDALARIVDIDPTGLQQTVERWNGFVTEGQDHDFGRGDSAFDRYQGDLEAPHPNLGTIEKGPFYALPVLPGALGTKGGPRTDGRAQVLDVFGATIGGLYAAGNVAASVAGPSYYGVGSTLGPAITFGYIAGNAVMGVL